MSVHRRPDRPTRPWQVKWRDEVGKQRSRSFETRREAVLFDADVLRSVNRVAPPAPVAQTLTEWAATWVDVHGPAWAPSTQDGRALYLDKWILPWLGDTPIDALTRHTVSRWRATIHRDGASADTVNHATRVLSACLGKAVDDGFLAGNPCRGLRAMRHRVERPRAYTAGEVKALLDAAGNRRDRRLMALMVHAGLRPGEAIALRWEDIGADVIHVTRSVRVDGSASTPKGMRGRTIRISAELRRELAPRGSDGLVVPAAHGGHLNWRGWYRGRWKPVRERSGVVGAPYDFRHTFASRRIAEGANVVEVAAEMGHADPALTLRRYAHLFDAQRAASDSRSARTRRAIAPRGSRRRTR